MNNKVMIFPFLLAIFFGTSVLQAQEGSFSDSFMARVHFIGHTIDVSLPPDFKHMFETELGRVRLPLKEVKTLRVVDAEVSDVLIGKRGSRWLVRQSSLLVSRILDERNPLLVPVGEDLSVLQLKGVSFAFQGESSFLEGAESTLLLQSVNGQLMQVESRQDYLTLETRYGREKVPLNRLSRVDFFTQAGQARPLVRAYWLSGFSLEGTLVDRQMKFRDPYGNKVTGRSEQLSHLYCGPVEKDPKTVLTRPHQVDVFLEDGRAQTFSMMPMLIPFKTARGALYFTSSEILEWEALSGGKEVVLCLTDGSIVIGKPLLSQMTFLTPGLVDETLSLGVKEIARLTFKDNESLDLGFSLYWTLENAELLRCDLKAASYRLLYEDGFQLSELEIPSEDIQSIVLTNFPSITLSTAKRRYTLTPEMRAIELVMTRYQGGFSLPWSEVKHVLRQKSGIPSLAVWRTQLGEEELEGSTSEMREIFMASGSFEMGATREVGLDDEGPVHSVALDAFYMDEHEVTVAQFRRFVEDTGYRTTAEEQHLPEFWDSPGFVQEETAPVTWISWFDAVAFCNWRSKEATLELAYFWNKKERRFERQAEMGGYRLPTEAEWEFAARSGGKALRYPWGSESKLDEVVRLANFQQHRTEPYDNWFWTNPVEHFSSNEMGFFGMAGNVWEWCEDWYHPDAYYMVHRSMLRNPVVLHGDAPGLKKRVMRGGSFGNKVDFLRCTSRGSGAPGASANRVGFRCVRSVVQPVQ